MWNLKLKPSKEWNRFRKCLQLRISKLDLVIWRRGLEVSGRFHEWWECGTLNEPVIWFGVSCNVWTVLVHWCEEDLNQTSLLNILLPSDGLSSPVVFFADWISAWSLCEVTFKTSTGFFYSDFSLPLYFPMPRSGSTDWDLMSQTTHSSYILTQGLKHTAEERRLENCQTAAAWLTLTDEKAIKLVSHFFILFSFVVTNTHTHTVCTIMHVLFCASQ